MNMTETITQTGQVGVEWEYTAIVALGLFVLSEVMPFIKKTKGAGVIHSLICLLKGSKCMVDSVLEVAENAVKDDEEPKV
tara:strand:+ start:23567 stop:23806 length:240 start_codon:yes stop_codon:yes gene_type:complete